MRGCYSALRRRRPPTRLTPIPARSTAPGAGIGQGVGHGSVHMSGHGQSQPLNVRHWPYVMGGRYSQPVHMLNVLNPYPQLTVLNTSTNKMTYFFISASPCEPLVPLTYTDQEKFLRAC